MGVVQQYRRVLESAGLAPASINLRLSAIRKLAAEAAENDLLDRRVVSVAPGDGSILAAAKGATAPMGDGAPEAEAQWKYRGQPRGSASFR